MSAASCVFSAAGRLVELRLKAGAYGQDSGIVSLVGACLQEKLSTARGLDNCLREGLCGKAVR